MGVGAVAVIVHGDDVDALRLHFRFRWVCPCLGLSRCRGRCVSHPSRVAPIAAAAAAAGGVRRVCGSRASRLSVCLLG